MKTRVVVWSVVGIIIVGMVLVMVFVWRPEGKRPVAALEDVQREVGRSAKVVDELSNDVLRLRANPAVTPFNDSLARAERLLNTARQYNAALQSAADPGIAGEELLKARAVIDTVRGILNRIDRKLKPRP